MPKKFFVILLAFLGLAGAACTASAAPFEEEIPAAAKEIAALREDLQQEQAVLQEEREGLRESMLEIKRMQRHFQLVLNATRSDMVALYERIPEQEEFSAPSLYNQVREGVVEIRVSTFTRGAGFMVGPDEVATAAHVVEDMSLWDLKVVTADNRTVYVENVKVSEQQDIAVLKLTESLANYHPLAIGASSELAIGDPILVVGHPFGHAFTASKGIVSGLNRDRDTMNVCPRCTGLIQLDAPINGGNSGGPVINEEGEVVGIISWGQGKFSFAASARHLQSILADPYEKAPSPPTGEIQIIPGWREEEDQFVQTGELAVLWFTHVCVQREDATFEGIGFSIKGGDRVNRYFLTLDNAQIGDAESGSSVVINPEGVTLSKDNCARLELIGSVGDLEANQEIQVSVSFVEARGVLSENLLKVTGNAQGSIRRLGEPRKESLG